jgi:DNA-binding SARP family transcriptional activator/Tfp pilus assembly protein PilF
MAVEFRILGSLEIDSGSGTVALRARKQRILLAVLLCQANQPVSMDRLSAALWGDSPPPAAAGNLRQYVLQVRRSLGNEQRIEHRGPGYALTVRPGELDADRFQTLAASGSAAVEAGDPETGARLLGEALALWRGPAYADLSDVEILRDEAVRLEERRHGVLEARIDAELRLGRHAQLVAELSQFAREHPLRERTRAQLMTALYRSGRQADALEVYRETRKVLADELGLEPGAELRRLERAILISDPDLDRPVPAAVHASGVPALLPADVPDFVGRESELADLDRLWESGRVITAISGTAGVGKSALAVRWAHRVRDAFPDGQLYVNLRGYDPEQPMSAADALAGFLHALGVRGHDIPLEVDGRAARYRSELAGRRLLVLLDNAGSVEQVRPLLPGTPGCLVLVTSRDSLAGLVALNGARRLDLDLLPASEAVALLRRLAGGRVDAQPEAAAALAGQCARLPLALRVAAELAAARPSATLAQLVAELAGYRQRLDLLDAGGDPRTAVRTVFSWSYRHLPADAARVFRLLGLHPGPDLDLYAAAALTGTGIEDIRRPVTALARAHLIQEAGEDRWAMHDLLRAYALELTGTEELDSARNAALTSLVDHYLATATRATAVLDSASADPDEATAVPPMDDPAAARGWLDAERANLVAACACAAAHGWHARTVALSETLVRYLDSGGHFSDAVLIHTLAGDAARLSGERGVEARALANLGRVYRRLGQLGRAAGIYQQSVALYADTGDPAGRTYALRNLGSVHWRQGRYDEAAIHYEQALALCRQGGDEAGEADALNSLGLLHQRLGRVRLGSEQLSAALVLYRRIGDSASEAYVLSILGRAHRRPDQIRAAAASLEEVLAGVQQAGNRTGEAYALTDLAGVYLYQGRLAEALRQLRQALVIYQEIGDRASEAEVLNGLGETLRALGTPAEAIAQHTKALTMADAIGDRYEQARAHDGIAASQHLTGDTGRAAVHWRDALELYIGLGVPEAEAVRARLAGLSGSSRVADHAES